MSDTLLLNSDTQPISWLPLSTLTWQDAIKYLVLEKARVLEWHDDWIVRSANWRTPVPSVMMLHEYMKPKVVVRYSKSNVFLRDQYTCQYCGAELTKSECTLDHVLPVSLGGKNTFENSVCACIKCNSSKGNNHKIKPKVKPVRPDFWDLVSIRKKLSMQIPHPTWVDYLHK